LRAGARLGEALEERRKRLSAIDGVPVTIKDMC